jgi:hypothetical protein
VLKSKFLSVKKPIKGKDQTMLRTLTIILTILATAHCLANPPVAQQDAPAPRTILALTVNQIQDYNILPKDMHPSRNDLNKSHNNEGDLNHGEHEKRKIQFKIRAKYLGQ